MVKKLSAKERQRRFKQSQAQWEKDNPVIAHAIKNFKCPEKLLSSIQYFDADNPEPTYSGGVIHGY